MKNKKFFFHVPGQTTEYPLVFAYSDAVEPRSIVAKFGWRPEDPSNLSMLNLTWSEALKSHFTYVPEATNACLQEGATIIIDGPGTLEIELLEWPSRKPLSDDKICGVYIKRVRPSSGTAHTTLQRIFEVGTNQ